MKKVFVIAMTCVLAAGMTAGATAFASADDGAAKSDENVLYLVPGSYTDYTTGEKIYNSVGTGARKLTEAECDAVYTENAYICEVAAGNELPVPATEREGYSFNGWWGIVDATVTYFTEVPQVTETFYLYADWRTALSQPMSPIIPDGEQEATYEHYMEVTRAATGETEKIPLFVSGTDVSNAVQAGYGGPVQFYNEWFQLSEGDEFKVYVSRVYGSTPVLAPQGVVGTRKVTLESSGSNSTASSIACLIKGELPSSDVAFSGDYSVATNGDPMYRCIRAGENNYRIYIKFYDNGGTMTIYMEKLSSVN